MRNDRKPRLQSLLRLPPQLCDLVIGKLWQDRIPAIGLKRTAARDFDRVVNGFGQVRKQRDHFRLRLEIMLRCKTAAALLLVHIGAFRNADQRIMRLVHIRGGEVDVVRGHQGNVHGVGHLDKSAFGQPLGLGRAAVTRMALQLHVQTADHIRAMRRQLRQRHLRQRTRLVEVEARIEFHQMLIPPLTLREQHDRGRQTRFLARLGRHIFQIDLTTDDRLHARPRHRHRKLQRREHVVRIGQRQRRHACLDAHIGQLFQPQRPFQQRIFGMRAQVDESGGIAHARRLKRIAKSLHSENHRPPLLGQIPPITDPRRRHKGRIDTGRSLPPVVLPNWTPHKGQRSRRR